MSDLEIEYTEIEQEAIADGWKPQDQLDDGVDFISAEKFVENGSFFRKINSQKKRIENLESSISQLNEHNNKAAEAQRKQMQKEFDERIESLEKAKVEALDDGDHEKVVKIDKELRKTETKTEPDVNTAFMTELAAFKSDNEWYETDSDMTEDADSFGLGYSQRYPDAKPEKIFEHVMSKMKKLYPDKFENPKRNEAASVEGDKPSAKRGKSVSTKDLTQDEMKIFTNFDRMSVFKTDDDRKKYVREVISTRG